MLTLNSKKQEFRNKLNASKIIVIFGERNVDNFIHAVNYINKSYQDISIGIVIVGKIKARNHTGKKFVHYTGILSETDVSFHLQIADLFVLPERVYKNNRGGATFKSGSLAAALATPLPVLTSKGDMTEAPPLIHGENIWFTNFHNETQLQKEIIQLLSDTTLLNKLKEGGEKLYRDYLNWDVVSGKYIEMFQ
jgi:glycosyltransferase involved in cell wall biosynthesis